MEKPVKNLGGRPLKALKYQKEKDEILIKLNNILGITETNDTFYLHTVDDDENKINQIMALFDDCKLYFNASGWAVTCKPVHQRRYLSLTRSIYKDMGYKLDSIMRTFKEGDKMVRRTGYIISKNDE